MADSKSAQKPVNPTPDIIGVVDTKREEEGEWFTHPDEHSVAGPTHVDGFRDILLDANGNGLRGVHVRSRFTSDYRKAEQKLQARAAESLLWCCAVSARCCSLPPLRARRYIPIWNKNNYWEYR